MGSSRSLLVAAALAALVVCAATAAALLAVRTQAEAAGWVAHTHRVIANLEATRAAVASAESASRAFVLTGDERVLEDMGNVREAANEAVAEVAGLTADNPEQRTRVPVLHDLTRARFDLLERMVALRREDRVPDALALLRDVGLPQGAQLRRVVGVMETAEGALLQKRLEDARRAATLGAVAVAGTGAVALAALAALYLASAADARRLARERQQLHASREETRLKASQLAAANAQLGLANEQLREGAALLEERVRERTDALADANAQLESFARTVAHDLRAPLRNIQGYAGALLEDEQPRMSPQGVQFAQRLLASAGRLDRMVRDLLAYSSLARSQLQLEPVPLQPLVDLVLDELRDDIAAAGGEVAVRGPLPVVQGHRATLAQVVRNLVGNALKFVAPGVAPRVAVSAQEQGGLVHLLVDDNGIGIPPEHGERVFAVFERLHAQDRYPGTGIGLAIVRKGVERMGGSVGVQPRAEGGSRFVVRLQRPSAAAAEARTSEPAEEAA